MDASVEERGRTADVVVHERAQARDDGAVGAKDGLELVEAVVEGVAGGVDLEGGVDVEEEERVALRKKGEGGLELCASSSEMGTQSATRPSEGDRDDEAADAPLQDRRGSRRS